MVTSVRSAHLSTPGTRAMAWPVATRAVLPGRSAAARSMRAVTPARAASPAQQCRRAVVVLGPGLVGQRPDVHRAASGPRVSDGQHDDHVVRPEEPPFDARVVGEPRWRIGDDGDVEVAGGHALVQWCAQPGQQAPAQGSGRLQQTADRRGHDPGCQGRRRADGQRPGQHPVTNLPYGTHGAVGLVEPGRGVVAEHLAGRCRPHAAHVPLHQRHPSRLLQSGDLPGDGRLRVTEFGGRRRQRPDGDTASPQRSPPWVTR